MAEGSISPEQYRQWLTPKRALAEVERHVADRAEAKLRIIEDLGVGVITAVAYRMISETGDVLGGSRTTGYAYIPRSAWPHGDVTDTFWEKGDIYFRKLGLASPWGPLDGRRECIAVRLDPMGIELVIERVLPVTRTSTTPQISRAPAPIAPLSGQSYAKPKPPFVHPGTRSSTTDDIRRRVPPPYAAKRSGSAASDRPRKVTKDELRQWFPIYEKTSSDFSEGAVRAAAEKYFHPRPVTRQPVREIIAEFERTLTRGKPTGR